MLNKMYCSVEDIENYLLIEIAPEFETQIENWIKSASNYVAVFTNRDWLADVSTSPRLFNGNGCQSIEVPDFIGTPVVEFGDDYAENFTATTNFLTSPYNTENKTHIVMKGDNVPHGTQNVRITAKWGFGATVPEDIKQATVIIASAIVLAGTNQDGEIESEKIGNYQVKYKSDAHKDDTRLSMSILESRRVIRL